MDRATQEEILLAALRQAGVDSKTAKLAVELVRARTAAFLAHAQVAEHERFSMGLGSPEEDQKVYEELDKFVQLLNGPTEQLLGWYRTR